MTKDEIQELRTVKNEPCVSIIVPVHKSSPKDKEQDTIIVDNAVHNAARQLQGRYGEKRIEPLLHKLNRVAGGLKKIKDSEGLGIFLSRDILKVVGFPFEVQEKVFVGEEFETRDLIYTTKSLFDYYFLLLSGKVSRLFKGFGDVVTEVVDENYPRTYEDNYEYEKAYLASSENYSLKSEGEKSMIEQRRMRDYLKQLDYFLFLYLKRNTPLIIGGTEERLSMFSHVTSYNRNIIGAAYGSFDHATFAEIRAVIKKEIGKHVNSEHERLVRGFQEMVGSGKVLWGIGESWKAAADGKVQTMLVEKDYICPARLAPDGRNIVFEQSKKYEQYPVVNDAVNTLISMVIDKGGDVTFLENGKLAKYDKLAVLLRYSQ